MMPESPKERMREEKEAGRDWDEMERFTGFGRVEGRGGSARVGMFTVEELDRMEHLSLTGTPLLDQTNVIDQNIIMKLIVKKRSAPRRENILDSPYPKSSRRHLRLPDTQAAPDGEEERKRGGEDEKGEETEEEKEEEEEEEEEESLPETCRKVFLEILPGEEEEKECEGKWDESFLDWLWLECVMKRRHTLTPAFTDELSEDEDGGGSGVLDDSLDYSIPVIVVCKKCRGATEMHPPTFTGQESLFRLAGCGCSLHEHIPHKWLAEEEVGVMEGGGERVVERGGCGWGVSPPSVLSVSVSSYTSSEDMDEETKYSDPDSIQDSQDPVPA